MRKSKSCIGKVSGKPLTEYDSESEAMKGADYEKSKYGNSLIPYLCNNCDMWHLALKNRQTPSYECDYCTDSEGEPKRLYQSYEDAERRAEIIYEERGIELDIYECEHDDGWHLTSSY